jgi:hypothetical protein
VVVGCGKDSSEDGIVFESKSETYRYEYESNGCNTGSHSFSNLGELCDALQSRATNRGCALSLRQDGFKDWNCPGTFQEKP